MAWDCSNQFRRSGQRDDRRRLLLNEELCRKGPSRLSRRAEMADQNDLLARKSPHYGEEALACQPRITDLVPRRLPAYFFLLLLGIASIAGIEAIHVWVPRLPPFTASGGVAAFELIGTGTVAAWFSSVTFLAVALGSILVYSVRRYRTDDYRGYYRIWLWAASFWFLMSLDATTGLRVEFKNVMTQLTGAALYGDGVLWWAVPYLVVLSALGSRLAVDVWPARLSTAAISLAGICLTLAVAAQIAGTTFENSAVSPMIVRGAEMLGCWMLLVATAVHTRYVVLDAEGRLPRPENSPEVPYVALDSEEADFEESDASYAGDSREWIAIDSPHQSPAPVLRRRSAPKPKAKPKPKPEPEFDAADAAASLGRKLTKQEKKALRQRLMRERLQREQSQQRKWA